MLSMATCTVHLLCDIQQLTEMFSIIDDMLWSMVPSPGFYCHMVFPQQAPACHILGMLKSHGQRSLVSYSLWGCKESDMTE